MLKKLEDQMHLPHFWDDQNQAKQILEKRKNLRLWVDPVLNVEIQLKELEPMLKEAIELNEEELIASLYVDLDKIEQTIADLELKRMLSCEFDQNACFFSINAGAGGTEACDWVEMLSRMYTRWAQKKRWKIEVINRLEGDVAGIKSITYQFDGPFAYGYSKAEIGVHRLVRISPFDANKRRHTSFASVEVIPLIEEEIDIEIRPEDLRVDTFRSSGAGGQHVNTTDSAVRITHLPTKIVVSCQKERSQQQNRHTCMQMLKARLYEMETQKKREKAHSFSKEKMKIEWGSQIRSYVFQPYTLVKDARTKTESGNIEAVMDGEIDIFVESFLKQYGGAL